MVRERMRNAVCGAVNSALRTPRSALIRWLTPPVLALALYWRVLGLPFFWDDVPNFNFLAGRTLVELWTSAAGFPYYRPLGFTVWRIVQLTFGATNTPAHHAVNLIVLIADGWLVGALALRLARRPSLEAHVCAWAAGALLTAFPFAALAVPLVASLFHLLVTFVVLVGAVALLEYMRTGRRGWSWLSVASAMLAPFVHESGVAAGGMLAALWLFAPGAEDDPWWGAARRRGLSVVSAAVALNALFVPLWLAVPKMRTGGNLPGGLQPHELWLNTVFFVVSLTYPLQPLALKAQLDWGWVDVTSVLVFGGLALAIVAALVWRTCFWRLVIGGLGFAIVGAVPAILTLPFLYVIVSPRLMILGAPGVALAWGAAIAGLTARTRAQAPAALWRSWLPALIAMGLIVAVPIRHTTREVGLHVRALAPVSKMVRAFREYPGDRHLVVNPTTWLSMAQATYPIAHEGVVVFPEYVSPAQLAEIHTGAPVQVDGVAFPPLYTEPAEHYYDVWGPVADWESLAARIRTADRVWLVTYDDGPLGFVGAGVAAPETEPAPLAATSFAEHRVVLERAVAAVAGDELDVQLDWRVLEPTGEEVFTHALDCAGKVLGLADGPPVGRMFPFWLWQPGERMRDLRRIPLQATAADGCYVVEVGLFNPADGTRPAAFDAGGERLPNDALYLGVQAGD
ncbi:MAG: hypothetical protein ACE5FI_02335 [Anaerolineales bacterium]